METTVYIAINEQEAYDARVLYAGTDQGEAIQAIEDSIMDDIQSLVCVSVDSDGTVELNFTGDYRIQEVKV